MTTRLDFVSMFSGAGGLDLGFELAGWNCLYAMDSDPAAIATLQANAGKRVSIGPSRVKAFSQALLRTEDAAFSSGRKILSTLGRRKGDIPALVGGPPCQSWSSAGSQLGFRDPRGRLFSDYLRLATELDVRWLVFENVRGLLTARGDDGVPGSALHFIRQALLDAGFQTEVNLLNAADYGVPQRRVRLFMIGFRRGDRPAFPEATHARDIDLLSQRLQPWVTLKECLQLTKTIKEDEIIRPSQDLSRLLSRLPPGSGLKSPGKPEATRPGGHWGYKQGCFVADPSLPARTVTASSQQDWIRDEKLGLRRLSPRECAALQTFPPDWTFVGSRALQYRQIGNAVPPLLARSVAASLAEHVTSSMRFKRAATTAHLLPLRQELVSAIEYTRREESRNGESRRESGARRDRRYR